MTEAQNWIDKWIHLPRWDRTEQSALVALLLNAHKESKELYEEIIKGGDRKWTFRFKDGSRLEISNIDQLTAPATAKVLK